MSFVGVHESEATVALTFARTSPGLWKAIVDQIAPRDPAGSVLAGPVWPGQPVPAVRGMFDLDALPTERPH